MAAHEQFGPRQFQALTYARGILAWVAADMSHHHLDTLDLKDFHLLEASAQARPVHVAAHGTEHGGDGLQPVGQVVAADIASVPYLITVGKVLGIAVVPPRMRVTDDAYFFHF